jgi:hypothetical protein
VNRLMIWIKGWRKWINLREELKMKRMSVDKIQKSFRHSRHYPCHLSYFWPFLFLTLLYVWYVIVLIVFLPLVANFDRLLLYLADFDWLYLVVFLFLPVVIVWQLFCYWIWQLSSC